MFYNKKIVLTFLAAFALVSSALYFLLPKKYFLSVGVFPEDASIVVEGVGTTSQMFGQKLSPGNYLVSVTKIGYVPYQRIINLKSNTNLNVELNKIQDLVFLSPATNIAPGSLVNLSAEDNLVIGIDSTTGALIKKVGNTNIPLSPGPIKDYSLTSPLVAFIKNQDAEALELVNTETGTSQQLDVSGYRPVVSVSLSADKKHLFFLGKYDHKTNNAGLYVSPLAAFLPKLLVETKANVVKTMTDNVVLLITESEAQDKSRFVVYDYNLKAEIASVRGNNSAISPSATGVAVVSSQTLLIIDTKTRTKNSTSVVSGAIVGWVGNERLVVFANKHPGVEVYTINAKTLEPSQKTSPQELKHTSVLGVESLGGDAVLAIDREGEIWKTTIK